MIGLIDYGAGNIGNVERALKHLGRDSAALDSPDAPCSGVLEALLLPGVGSFPSAMASLFSRGWPSFISEWVRMERPLIGICLGMQILCEGSTERGWTKGMGIFQGVVDILSGTRKLPHVGWNSLEWVVPRPGGIATRPGLDCFYFVHSYGLAPGRDTVATTTVDETCFSSVVKRDRTIGFQFHPERSGFRGLEILSRTLKELGV
ncbi:MAG TPA: imidazole glycerol phosphate synthase subunit HisH [Synergistales bacterium]|nr:imidazole glycerol phosphate synthase subunit HisH [Synergistaceae bacterium]HOI81727.1 imidazole glycerol phosphate synthase subunit HisH [Synergistales bacterium]